MPPEKQGTPGGNRGRGEAGGSGGNAVPHSSGQGGAVQGSIPLHGVADIDAAKMIYMPMTPAEADVINSIGLASVSLRDIDSIDTTDYGPLAGKNVTLVPAWNAPSMHAAIRAGDHLLQLKPAPFVQAVRVPGVPVPGGVIEWVSQARAKATSPSGLASMFGKVLDDCHQAFAEFADPLRPTSPAVSSPVAAQTVASPKPPVILPASPPRGAYAGNYYRDLRARADIGAIARDLLEDRVTSEDTKVLLCDCPRHASQSKEALRIQREDGLWYCFGCQLGGDVIQLVEFVHEGTVSKCTKGRTTQGHRAARDWLAAKVGMPILSKLDLSAEDVAKLEAEEEERERVFGALTIIAAYYHQKLLESPDVLQWLEAQYGFTREIVERFKLGWPDDAPETLTALRAAGLDDDLLIATGAFRRDSYGRVHPFYEKRVLFPYELAGRTVYMIGRRTPWTSDAAWEQGKYKKLPVYDAEKHPHVSKVIDNSVLFGESVLASRPKEVVVCEGITDAIRAQFAGFAAISPVTVSLKESDIERITAALARAVRVYIVLDNEISGVGDKSSIAMAKALDAGESVCLIVALPLREPQETARAKLRELLGDEAFDQLAAAEPHQKKAILDKALAERPEEVAKAAALIADSKIDVCEWFKLGGTAAEFQELLDNGREVIEVEIDRIPGEDDPRARAKAVHEILDYVRVLPPILQEQYVKLIKERTGLTIRALREHLDESQEEPTGAVAGSSKSLSSHYERRSSGMVRVAQTPDGEAIVPLTNFPAEIKACVGLDDGVSIQKTFEIEAVVMGVATLVTVPASEFAPMAWAITMLGPKAIVSPGSTTKDHARAAIQHTSLAIAYRTVYTHTGWRDIPGEGWCYLHAGGAIRPDRTERTVKHIEVQLPEALANYILPEPQGGEARSNAIQAVLRLLLLAPGRIIFVLLGAVFRVVLGNSSSGVHLVGPTGVFKSELAALIQQFFGAKMDAKHLPGSWESTANFLEMLAFAAMDAIVTIDDFKPKGSTQQIQKAHAAADRLFRSQGNHAGRGRMRADRSMEAMRPPRGMVLSTGEETPAGESLRARVTIVEVSIGDVDTEVLTACQADAGVGLYEAAMAAFLQWIANGREAAMAHMAKRLTELRQEIYKAGHHRRTPTNVADLQLGVEMFLNFAVSVEAVTKEQAHQIGRDCRAALLETSDVQQAHVLHGEPTQVFLRLLQAAVACGEAHIADKKGELPIGSKPEALGWTQAAVGGTWNFAGARVGWIDGDDLYLELTSSYKAAQKMAGDTDRLVIDARTLSKRLSEKRLLVTEDEARRKHTVRRTLQGRERVVLHLAASALLQGDPRSDWSDGSAHPSQEPAEANAALAGQPASVRQPDPRSDAPAAARTGGDAAGPDVAVAEGVGPVADDEWVPL